MATPNRPTQQDRFRKIIVAIQKYLSQLTQIILAGVTFTPASLVQFFQDQVKLLDDATAARAALRQAAQAIKENKTTKGPVLRAFNDFVLSMFVNQPTVLADFGVPPRKTATKKVDTKQTAVEKALATRKARHTMGKRQKQKVKGVVPAPAPAPSPEPVPPLPLPAPAPAQAPAPAASPSNGATPPAGSVAAPQAPTPAPTPASPPTHA